MKTLAFGLLACLPLWACATVPTPVAGAPAHPQTPVTFGSRREIVKRILAQNVRLVVMDGAEARITASGVVIGSEVSAQGSASYILTNAHVLDTTGFKDGHLQALVDQADGEAVEYQAEPVVVGRVPEMDLALVKIWGVLLTPAQLADDAELIPGEVVIVAGAPFGKPVSLSGGMVSQVEFDPKSHQPKMLKTDAPIGYGASGGGVYSQETGRLLAVVEGYRTAKVGFSVAEQAYSFDVPMPGETFAAPTAKVRSFLNGHGFIAVLGDHSRSPGASREAAR